MPLIETKGTLSSQAYGQFARQAPAANYIEDVFSTYLYTGNGSTQTITNGIDFSTKGGLLWIKGRSATSSHWLVDTARGNTKGLYSDGSVGEQTSTGGADVSGFLSSGFSLGTNQQALVNTNGGTFASWSFRKQAKFFDVVTYTGNGANRTIAHNLGSIPGCIIVKRTDTTGDWQVYHRSLANTEYMVLNSTAVKATGATRWNSTTPTATVFSLGTDATVNASGGTYVAYLFAHDAGGFGAAGTDNAISCETFTTDGSGNATVTLGWEPQWIMRKSSSSAATGWEIGDNMRGLLAPPSGSPFLTANTALAESSLGTRVFGPTATGFTAVGSPSTTYIYMAIRRGPMRTPTSGTSVFSPSTQSSAAGSTVTTNIAADAYMGSLRGFVADKLFVDKLRGFASTSSGLENRLYTNLTSSETGGAGHNPAAYEVWNTDFKIGASYASASNVFWMFRRAPGFFDVVCYTGTGANLTVSHNLGAAPQMMWVKTRTGTFLWGVYDSFNGATKFMRLNGTNPSTAAANYFNNTSPTSSVFTVGTALSTVSENYVAYLFGSVSGVSKFGNYTGTGSAQTINCDFTAGARFVLIKRTDTNGDWYVWDTARGISAGNDPYLLLNSTDAEVTGTNYISVQSSGFGLTATAPAGLNANGGSYIFFAIA